MWSDEASYDADGKPNDIWSESGTTFDDSVTVLEAAEQGQGLALARWSLATPSLASGQLVLAHPRAVPFPRSYYFVCPESYRTLSKVATFLEWLSATSASFPKPAH